MIFSRTGVISEKVSSILFPIYYSCSCDDVTHTNHKIWTSASVLYIFLRPLCSQTGKRMLVILVGVAVRPEKA